MPASPILPALADFQGEWRFDRRIRQGDGVIVRLAGRAVFTPCGDGLRMVESGVMRLAGQQLEARRITLWRATDEGIEIRFEDSRPFHGIAARQGLADTHLCGADRYRIAYGFRRWPAWRMCWQVTGPRKDYTALTRYWR